MNIEEIKKKLQTKEYSFLNDNTHLGKQIVLLTLGGSHAYGMENEQSDLDVRGIAHNTKKEILLGEDFGQVVDVPTDTTIYSFNKMIQLLTSNNPNTIEILGCKPEHYLYLSDVGRELLDNRKMFLSQVCIHTFGGYASSQLRRMENKAARLVGQSQNEEYILKSIQNAQYDFRNRYYSHEDGDVHLYVDDAVQEGYETEIFMDVNLKHYPLRDWTGMWNEMKAIVSSYNKIGMRNEKAIHHNKLGKHMAHLIRLYMMCIDILEKEEIITYREQEHELLMAIRNGEYLDENRQPKAEFYDLLNEYEKRFEYAKKNTSLPQVPDAKRINEFKSYVNERIIRDEIESGDAVKTSYITTYTRVHFDPTNPIMEDIHIEDIAHALSLICRGNGHVKQFFSVGQHCINCALESIARGYSDRVSLACLLHDAGEAYMSDVPRPIKNGMPQYKHWEEQLLRKVFEKYLGSELTKEEEILVKRIDDDMLYFDLKVLLGEETEGEQPKMERAFSHEYMPYIEVEKQYMEMFQKLMMKL